MAAGRFIIVFLVAIAFYFQQAESQSWSGIYENYRSCNSYRERVCAYSTWWGCCAYRWVWRERCNYSSRCQSGWRESSPGNCNVAICNPGCANGGTCYAPNRCSCAQGYTGPTCQGSTPCDIRRPCYPGVCSTQSCTCTAGFSGPAVDHQTCRTLNDPQKPEIFKCTSTIRNVDRSTSMEKYRYTVESANPNETDVEVLWSNYRMFNYIEMEGLALYDPMLPARPEYVSDSELGVVRAEVVVTHTKISRTPGQIDTPYSATWPCTLTDATDCRNVTSISQVVCGSQPCRAFNDSYTVSFETGDNFTMTLRFYAGGFRNINGGIGIQTFYTSQEGKTLHFRFDSNFPEHACMNNTHNCSLQNKPLDVGPMFTKSAITMRWGGWTDRVSGMHRYVWEVFPLQPNEDGELGETAPLSPVNDISSSVVNHSNIKFPTFTLPQPGIYSVILHASDLANNTVYVRQFVVYDPVSNVSVDSGFPMKVAEANSDRPLWVNELNSTLTLDWTGHFVNKMHEDKRILGPILPYPRQFQVAERDGFGRAKYIWDEVAIGPGQSQEFVRAGIPNARGIRQFWVQETRDNENPFEQRWTDVSLNLNYQFPGLANRTNGDKRRLWVRAQDFMNNTITDFLPIAFDSSAPILDGQTRMERNVKSTDFPFASRINVSATDAQSAVTAFRLQFTRNSTGSEVYNETIWRNPEVPYSQCSGTSCTCIQQNAQCYMRQVAIDINNCWLQVDRENVSKVSVDVTVTPINDAGLPGPSTVQQFSQLTELKGILDYAGPTNVTTSLLTAESVRLEWINLPTCYKVTEWWVKYYIDGKETKYYVDKRESVFMLPGLSPSTTYDIHIITGYDGLMSEPTIITITTHAGPLSEAQVAGIVVGSLLLLLILLAVIVAIMYMNGILFVLLRRPVPENRYRPSFMKRREKRSTGGVDGDVYIYGGDVAVPIGKQIADDRLSLIEVVNQGRFAQIYKANLNTDGRNETVAAKMLKEDRMTAEDAELMKTKMAYMTREVPSHPNVLQCLGGILESPWGPVIVLEFCENDTLRAWLNNHRRDVTDDVVERLYHFAHGVVKGMECLASAKIVHKRLAARNILLTFTMDVKVAGFGPTHLPGEEDQVKERLPVRWLPPECSSSLLNAEESTDVWSFAVTLWEIFSMGDNPYNDIDAHSIAMEIRRGRRLSKPEYCDETNFAMMQRCWAEKPSKRPSFKQLLRDYDKIMMGDHRQSTYNYGNPTYQP